MTLYLWTTSLSIYSTCSYQFVMLSFYLCLGRDENLAKIDKRISDYKIEVRNPPRAGKKLLVLDVDYTIFGVYNFWLFLSVITFWGSYIKKFLMCYLQLHVIHVNEWKMKEWTNKWMTWKINKHLIWNPIYFQITDRLRNLVLSLWGHISMTFWQPPTSIMTLLYGVSLCEAFWTCYLLNV